MEKFIFCIFAWIYISAATSSTPLIQNIANGVSKNLIGLATRGYKTDIVILLDMAGPRNSCHKRMHEYMKQFASSLICHLPTANGAVKVAVVSYASGAHLRYHYRMRQSRKHIENAIKRIRYTGGRRATGNALDKAIDLQFNRKYGGRSNAIKIVLVLTAGRNNIGPSASQSALCLKRKGAYIFVLGVGPYASPTEMKKLASHPIKNHAWVVKNPKYLRSISQKLLCPAAPSPTSKPTAKPTTQSTTAKPTTQATTAKPTTQTTTAKFIPNPTTKSSKTGTCKVNYKKIGCFSDPQGKHRPFPYLLKNARNLINWEKYKGFLEILIRHCAQRAKTQGFKYFAIQYYGECWSGPQPKKTMKKSTRCVNTKFKPCDPVQDCACTGKQHTNFVYER